MTNQKDKVLVSAKIICYNEEKKIRRALESVKWCDEIVIVDSGSIDKTLDICREYTDKIYHNDWIGYIEQKQFALSKCSHEWVVSIDADEAVDETLKENIIKVINNPDPNINGYKISRVIYFLDRWWKRGGWYPEYRLRFFRKDKAKFGGENPHDKVILEGESARLGGIIEHYTYDSFSHQINTMNKFSQIGAESLHRKRKRFSLFKLIFSPLSRFVKFYFIKKGFMEGIAGFILAINAAFYVFSKYAKLWEIEFNMKK